MFRLAVGFLVVALVAAIFGFVGVASDSREGAKVFFVFLAVLSFLVSGSRRRAFQG